MKNLRNSLFLFCILSCTLPTQIMATTQNKNILPEEFKVYYKKNVGVSQKAFKGSSEKLIPTSNSFEGNPGCYIACYSKNNLHGIYPVDQKTYLVGQIRVKGNYQNAMCVPTGYTDKDYRQAKEFKTQCEAEFPEACENQSCWISGQTADWF